MLNNNNNNKVLLETFEELKSLLKNDWQKNYSEYGEAYFYINNTPYSFYFYQDDNNIDVYLCLGKRDNLELFIEIGDFFYTSDVEKALGLDYLWNKNNFSTSDF